MTQSTPSYLVLSNSPASTEGLENFCLKSKGAELAFGVDVLVDAEFERINIKYPFRSFQNRKIVTSEEQLSSKTSPIIVKVADSAFLPGGHEYYSAIDKTEQVEALAKEEQTSLLRFDELFPGRLETKEVKRAELDSQSAIPYDIHECFADNDVQNISSPTITIRFPESKSLSCIGLTY